MRKNYQGKSTCKHSSIFAWFSVQHTQDRHQATQGLLPEASLAEGNIANHIHQQALTVLTQRGCQSNAWKLEESKLQVFRCYWDTPVTRVYPLSPAFREWGVKITKEKNLLRGQMQSSKSQRQKPPYDSNPANTTEACSKNDQDMERS